jgi:hypothetical protein
MSFASRHLAPALVVLAVTIAFAHSATADPDIDSESAATVIEQLQEQGYAVTVNGVPSGDTSLLQTCVVTKIHNAGGASSDPTTTTPVSVDVACPIQR